MPRAKPQTSTKRKTKDSYKEPTKDRVELIASSMQDIYSLIDSGIGFAAKATGREYPDGLFELDPHKAQKAARALAQINNSLPRLAEKMNKISAPLTLASILLTDLALKGVMVYAIFRNKPGAGNNVPAHNGSQQFPTSDQGSMFTN